MKMVCELQPEVLVNDLADLKDYAGGWDFTSRLQFKGQKWPEENGVKIHGEICQTFYGSCGYYCDEMTWKSGR